MKAKEYLKGIKNCDVGVLSKAITLIESTREKDRKINYLL